MYLTTSDQADTLRALRGGFPPAPAPEPELAASLRHAMVVAVASGKGGVGKTSVVANLAIALARRGRQVLAVDGDLGLANLDLALGIQPDRTLLDLVEQRATIDEIVTPAPGGVSVLPACSGRYDLANLGDEERYGLFGAIDALESQYDTLLIDTSAGIGSNAVAFAGAARDVLVVTTPDPASQMDAYAFIKVLVTRTNVTRIHVLSNLVTSPAEGEVIYSHLASLVSRFLGVELSYLGSIMRDPAMRRSVARCTPVIVEEPDAPASRNLDRIAHALSHRLAEPTDAATGGIQLFWRRLLGAEFSGDQP